ncbi:GNAT family N-acetyltransferase [Chitinophaga lutea]
MADTAYDIRNNEQAQQFELSLDGELAYLVYRFYKKNIAFMHTVVPDSLGGKGIATALAEFAFRYADDKKKKVMVYCPFVAGFVRKHPEYRQQLDPEYHQP